MGTGDRIAMANNQIHEACERDQQTIKYAENLVTQQMAKVGYTGGFGHGDDMNHWAGSCKLGSCANPETLIVYGTSNIVVADASILPSQVWAHPSLTLQALALRASDILTSQV